VTLSAKQVRACGIATALGFSLVACGDANSPGEPFGVGSFALTPTYGVDYSFARPSPASIVAGGFTFVVRYLSNDPGKDLSASEAQSLQAAGLDIVCNWEASATNALSGYNQGVSDAQDANAEAAADGAPADRPIYFSVDFDASSGQAATIDSYFDGVASVIGKGRTGAYGGYYIINQLFGAGKITFGWQTYAWSNGSWDAQAQLRQVENGIDNDSEDKDEAMVADFGQWGPGAPSSVTPAGYLDEADCNAVAGWAWYKPSPGTAIFADIYYDGAAGSAGSTGIRLTAGNARADLCTAIGSCNHGFSMPPPRGVLDGSPHAVYAYGINPNAGDPNALLSDAPKTLTCPAPAIAAGSVKRHVTNPTILSDWRFDTFVDMASYTTAAIAAVADGADFGDPPDLVQVSGQPAIYVVDGTYSRHVVNPESFSAWRFTGADVKPITAAALSALTTGPDWPAVPLLVKDPTAPSIYLLDTSFAADDGGATGDADGGSLVGSPVLEDGGASRAEPRPRPGSGGCSVGGGSAPFEGAWLLLAFAPLVLRVRRRRSPANAH
jgi:glycoside hydrolase-like protein